ncbi:MAG: hypothetical protein OEV59_03380 [Deltaproteobacteria bacterium]|nr:hypothetical protein [Deltaproteobacteria bacterium]
MLKRTLVTITAAVVMMFGSSSVATAAEATASGSVDWLTTYVWRGMNLGGNEGVIQPSATIVYDGHYSFNLWSNYDNERGEMTETDYTASYVRELGPIGLTLGFIHYGIDDGDVDYDSQEVYVTLSASKLPLAPTLSYYHDIDLGEGGYASLAISQSFELTSKLSFGLGALAGFNFGNALMETDYDGDGEVDDFSGLYNGEVSANLPYKVNDKVTITPKVAYSFPLGEDAGRAIRALSFDGDRQVVYGGINISIGL